MILVASGRILNVSVMLLMVALGFSLTGFQIVMPLTESEWLIKYLGAGVANEFNAF